MPKGRGPKKVKHSQHTALRPQPGRISPAAACNEKSFNDTIHTLAPAHTLAEDGVCVWGGGEKSSSGRPSLAFAVDATVCPLCRQCWQTAVAAGNNCNIFQPPSRWVGGSSAPRAILAPYSIICQALSGN